ncbi:MAG TPA: exodeoxyribonuclease VII small subunit [Clostridiales bacterium]|nr:exodeoxyribonuclease VII small subunit [Clostridiales bacterium]
MDLLNEKTFEQALEELEKLTQLLEKGNCTLDESILAFQDGIRLTAFCRKKLDEAEKKVTLLIEKTDGGFEEKEFAPEES